MVIAVNTIIATVFDQDENAAFITETFSRIIPAQPQHTFIIISEKKDNLFSSLKNVKSEIISSKKNLIQWYWWFNFTIPALLKKHRADLFFSYASISFSSVKALQYLLVSDLSFLDQPASIPPGDHSFYKKFLLKSMRKADKILTVSGFCRAAILNYAAINSDTIEIVYTGIPENISVPGYAEKELIKTNYAGNHEYFLYSGLIDERENLLNLLRAFSIFKKRQKSNMQLIIAGKQGPGYDRFLNQLRLYKFKEDVKILTGLSKEEKERITAAAYAFVYVGRFNCFSTECLLAMRLSVPVITSNTGAMHEICTDAALYVNPENFEEIALQMMLLFKDESLRRKLMEKGINQVKKFNWDVAAKSIWSSMTMM